MSGARETLIELLDDIQQNGTAFYDIEIHGVRIPDTVGHEEIADHLISNGVTVQQWISVEERLPEEHDSMFAKWYDTPMWKPGMFRTTSGDVLVCVEFGEGSRVVSTARTNAGEWNISSIFSGKVTHWMPLPEPPKEVR